MSTPSGSINKKSREERRRAFKAGKFPEHLITPDMIKTFTFVIECSPGQPTMKGFKLTEGMLLMRVPSFMAPPIEYCDYLVKINETPITTKKEMNKILKEASKKDKTHYLVFEVKRIMSMVQITENLPSNASIKKPKSTSPLVKPSEGYTYFKVVLIYFPRSKLGINVKSYNDVVYVESTDNTWGSTTRRFLYVGDAILKIDDTEILDTVSVKKSLEAAFLENGIVTLILERAVEPLSANYVRSVLLFNKCNDPQLAMDVINICRARHDYHVTNGFGPEPKSIFQVGSKSKKVSRVNVTRNVKMKTIGSEHYNPATMMKVPNYTDQSSLAKAIGTTDSDQEKN